MTQASPEIGQRIVAAGIQTNYHESGTGFPVLLIHGSGPGVSAWANWRLNIAELARSSRVLAPDVVGFGYTEVPQDMMFGLPAWVTHLVGFLDAKGIEKADLVGNSFGGALALAMAISHPQRVRKLVLMGSAGLEFDLTPGLDAVWGYTPSVENMLHLLNVFVHDKKLATPELAALRYQASVREGVQESFARMFSPGPRQRYIRSLASNEDDISRIAHKALVVHGRQDQVIPLQGSLRLSSLLANADMHVFPNCGHWTQIEKRAEFNQLVGHFLAADAP